MTEIPACGLERGFCIDRGVFTCGVGTRLRTMPGISVFGREVVFLVTHGEGFSLIQ